MLRRLTQISLVACTSSSAANFAHLPARAISTTEAVHKVKKGTPHGGSPLSPSGQLPAHIINSTPTIAAANRDMSAIVEDLKSAIDKQFAVQVDVRVFEDVPVKLESGEEKKLGQLARVSQKSPHLVALHFVDHPTALKSAKAALQKVQGELAVGAVQQEGATLYVPTPRMTKERREKLADQARNATMNRVRARLNEIYEAADKKGEAEARSKDARNEARTNLLAVKRVQEQRAKAIVEQKVKVLLEEMV